MANNNRCGCGRRNSNNYGCLNSLGGCWENYPYYGGPCPNADGDYGCDAEKGASSSDRRGGRGNRCREYGDYGIFSTMLPVAVATNGIVPLVNNGCLGGGSGFPINCGLITVDEGTYLATYTVRVPEGATVESTFSLNVNDACQSSSILQTGGEGPACFTGQAIFDVRDEATVTLRSSEAINITETSTQPLVTLSMVKI